MSDFARGYLALTVVLALVVVADIPPLWALIKTSNARSGWPMVAVLGGFLFLWAPTVGFGIAALMYGPFAGLIQ